MIETKFLFEDIEGALPKATAAFSRSSNKILVCLPIILLDIFLVYTERKIENKIPAEVFTEKIVNNLLKKDKIPPDIEGAIIMVIDKILEHEYLHACSFHALGEDHFFHKATEANQEEMMKYQIGEEKMLHKATNNDWEVAKKYYKVV